MVYFFNRKSTRARQGIAVRVNISPSSFQFQAEEWNGSIQSIQSDDFRDSEEGTAAIFHGRGGATRHNKYRRRKRVVACRSPLVLSSYASARLPNGHRHLPAAFDPWSKSLLPPQVYDPVSFSPPNFSPRIYLLGPILGSWIFFRDRFWLVKTTMEFEFELCEFDSWRR